MRAEGKHEALIQTRIPIKEFRARHLPPDIHWDLYRDVFADYVSRFGPNLFSAEQPATLADTAAYIGGHDRWS